MDEVIVYTFILCLLGITADNGTQNVTMCPCGVLNAAVFVTFPTYDACWRSLDWPISG